MDEHVGYLRFPSIHDEAIVFVSDDDLWRVPASGGTARRLTAGLSEPSTPCLSPDGRWIAFVGRDEQHPEVYLMAADGGPARRLTWTGPDVIVRGWTRNGHIVFVSTHGQPFFRNYRAFTLNPAGGMPSLLPLGQVNHLSFGPGKAAVIGRNTSDPARWKRYRGGTAGHLWVDALGKGQFQRLAGLAGNVTSPLWIGERIWFLSDAEGIGNVYSCRPDGSDCTRHTDHDDYYARHAQTDGKRIVYQCGGELWLFDPARDASVRVDVRLPSHRTQSARRFVNAADYLDGFNVHPQGHSVAIVTRGKLFTFPLWEGAVRQHGDDARGRCRLGQWLEDGVTLAGISDASGEEQVEVFEAGGSRVLPWDVGHVTAMRAAPRGSKVAMANHRNEVLIGDVASGTLSVVDRSDGGRTADLCWSPDGAWLAYSFWTSARHTAIKLHDVAANVSTLVTQPEFRDYSPAFDPAGRYLYFLSLRTFDPVYDSVQFELSFPRAARPYLVALQKNGRPPFDPAPKGLKSESREKDAQQDLTCALRPIEIEGIASRIAPFPVAENRFGKIVGVAGDKVVWSVLPIVGAHGRGGHKEGPGRLEMFDLSTGRAERLMDKADEFTLAADHVTLIVRQGKRLRAIAADRKPEDGDEEKSETPSRDSGWLDLDRVRPSIEPRREWKQMLREVWRLQRNQFWVENMSGVDWARVYDHYAPLVDRVSTRAELSDLIWEMQGELGTSHAYETGGDHRKPPQVALGYLAVETKLVPEDESYEITRIVVGDAWDAGADSPLNAVGVEAKVGERIVAINGQRTSKSRPPAALLVHQAGTKIELRLATGQGTSATTRDVLVTTLADEVPARYREWVERNRAWVLEKSDGHVGYLHLPDMMSAGFAEFHRYFSVECERDALVVDIRYNRGGHVSSLLLEKVARKRIGYDLSRWSRPVSYPDEALAGPVVALTNEHAGSDGDIFSHGFKLMGLGPLVGTRTWGGVVGIWPRHRLVDGSETTQPEYSFWFQDVGWGVENYGTDPTIEIDNAPQDAAAGRDRQLERAVATAIELVEKAKLVKPAFDKRPQLARGKLPPAEARLIVMLRRLCVTAMLFLAAIGAHALPPGERVRFDSLDREDGKAVSIEALLFRPLGASVTRALPAVIALHGCGGMYATVRGREEALNARHAAHAEAMLAAGYVVMFPDSFGSRGVREVCTMRAADRTIDQRRRRLDALGALQWLSVQRGVDRERIALLGWSHGGSTTLATINAGNRDVASFRARADAPFFRAAVAFYPGCTPASRDTQWRPAVATRVLIGAADDWTPAAACEALGERARQHAWPLEVTVYANAHHGFDAPRGKLLHRTDVPNGVNPGQGVHAGPDPAAREDAHRRVAAFLRESLAP